jgi:hypothetical protein
LALLDRDLTFENSELTYTLKIKRRVIEEHRASYRRSVCGGRGGNIHVVLAGSGPNEQSLRRILETSNHGRTNTRTSGCTVRTGNHDHTARKQQVAAARSGAVLASEGQYIFPLDAADRLRPGWIDQGIRILDSDPQVGVVYGDAEFFGTRTGRWHTGPFDVDRLLQLNYIPVAALYRRWVWEQNGGYDGSMPAQGF